MRKKKIRSHHPRNTIILHVWVFPPTLVVCSLGLMTTVVLVRYSIYRSIAILVNVRYRYLMVSRYFDISNDQMILGRYIVRSGVSSHSTLKQPSIWKHCPKTSISRYLLLIVRLSIQSALVITRLVITRNRV